MWNRASNTWKKKIKHVGERKKGIFKKKQSI